MGSIITLRFILISAINIFSRIGSYYIALPRFKTASMMGEQGTLRFHPDCIAYFNGTNPSQHSAARANFSGSIDEVAGSLELSFGMALWLALALHAIGVEIYVSGGIHVEYGDADVISSHSPRTNRTDCARSRTSGRSRLDLRTQGVRD